MKQETEPTKELYQYCSLLQQSRSLWWHFHHARQSTLFSKWCPDRQPQGRKTTNWRKNFFLNIEENMVHGLQLLSIRRKQKIFQKLHHTPSVASWLHIAIILHDEEVSGWGNMGYLTFTFTYLISVVVSFLVWRRKWQPTAVLLSGESHERRSLVSYSPRFRKESDTTEWLHFHKLLGRAIIALPYIAM